MTHVFQPLDLIVSAEANKFTRKEFVIYCSSNVQHQLQNGRKLKEVEVDQKLTSMKPLHAQWLVNMYNYFSGPDGKT